MSAPASTPAMTPAAVGRLAAASSGALDRLARAWWWLAALAAVVLVVAAVVSTRPRPAPPPPGPGPGPSGPLVAGEPGAVEIDVHQGEADVFVNGRLVGRTPYPLRAPLGTSVDLELRQPGFRPLRTRFDVTHQHALTLTMEPLAPEERE